MTQSFFYLDPEYPNQRVEWSAGKVELEERRCSKFPEHQRAGKRLTDLSIFLSGEALQDFVWTWYSELLVRQQVIDLMHSNGFTGFCTKPVSIDGASQGLGETELRELVVTGWGGEAAPQSGIVLRSEKSCSICGHLVYEGQPDGHLAVDLQQWDGSDLFLVWPLPRIVCVTERVARALQRHRFRGAVPKPIEQLSIAGEFSPGRLSDWFSRGRAEELGGVLGIA